MRLALVLVLTACQLDLAGKHACHVDADCDPGHVCNAGLCGSPCDGGDCDSECAADSDCAAGMVCNLALASCVDSAACASETVCPVNPADVCCGSICQQCCGTGPCASPAGTVCQGGSCVLADCPSPSPSSTLYVDEHAPMGGNGSRSCPFTMIETAVVRMGPAGGTIVVRGGQVYTAGNSRIATVPILFTGGDGNAGFAACNDTTCPSPAAWPLLVIKNSSHAGFQFTAAGGGGLRYFRITGPGSAATKLSGVDATGTNPAMPVALSHLRVSGFFFGIESNAGGAVSIGPDVQVTTNLNGLVLDNGSAAVTVVAGQAPVSFDVNDRYGVFATDASSLTLEGGPLLISASNNGDIGLVIHTTLGASISGVIAQHNGTLESPNSSGAGILSYTGTQLIVRRSRIVDNLNVGVNLYVDSSGTLDASGIDLGRAGDPGLNQLSNAIDICEWKFAADLAAQGNDFLGRNADCSMGAPALVFGHDCNANIGANVGYLPVSGDCSPHIDVGGCSYTPTCP